ncbi:MAG: lipopolysaccharide kinase InaA family protein [Candidatus Methylomirabilales bacterium]
MWRKREDIGERPHLVRLPINGVTWLVAEDDQERLLAAARAGWQGEVQRITSGRRVVRVDGRAGAVVLKHFRAQGVGAVLKGLLRISPASQEWTALHKVRRLGLPAPRPVALGKPRGLLHREGLLVTEALDGVLPLDAVLFGEGRVRGRARFELIQGAARLLRWMHETGVFQWDLHLGNILARPAAGGAELFLVDLQRVKVGTRLRQAIRWRDLAILHGGCVEASLTDRLRFLKAYLAGPPPLPVNLKALTTLLEHRGTSHRFRLWEGRKRRCVTENQEFCNVRVGGFSGFARRASWTEDLQHLFDVRGAIFTRPGVRMLKDSRTTAGGLIPSPRGNLFVKRYNFQSMGYAFKDLLRPSRARRVWVIANSLRMRGIPTPQPHAYLERRRLRVLLESYLVTEGVEGVRLIEFSDRFRGPGPSFLLKRRLAREIATLVRRLHERGVSHRDLKGHNLLVQEESPERVRPLLLDLDGVRIRRVTWRRRVRDLARLARDFGDRSPLTRTDRVRFLQAYLRPRRRHSWKKLWRRIAIIQARARANW